MKRPRALASVAAGLLAVAAILLQVGCAWRITPPALPEGAEASSVYVTSYGRHTRLALPKDENTVIEYGFGNWEYYALGQRDYLTGLVAIVGLGDATLSRRELPQPQSPIRFAQIAAGARSAEIQVASEQAEVLRLQLDLAWTEAEKVGETAYRANEDLHFVQVEDPYHLFHNSNTKVAKWLRQLGCEVEGSPILANFELVEKGEEDDPE